jgi:hypothetical protein
MREEVISDLEINVESVDIFSPELVRLDTGYINVKKVPASLFPLLIKCLKSVKVI